MGRVSVGSKLGCWPGQRMGTVRSKFRVSKCRWIPYSRFETANTRCKPCLASTFLRNLSGS